MHYCSKPSPSFPPIRSRLISAVCSGALSHYRCQGRQPQQGRPHSNDSNAVYYPLHTLHSFLDFGLRGAANRKRRENVSVACDSATPQPQREGRSNAPRCVPIVRRVRKTASKYHKNLYKLLFYCYIMFSACGVGNLKTLADTCDCRVAYAAGVLTAAACTTKPPTYSTFFVFLKKNASRM